VKEEKIMSFTGTWDVVSSPDFDDGYLHMEVAPYVRLRQEGDQGSLKGAATGLVRF
jgi:hypothetical protein